MTIIDSPKTIVAISDTHTLHNQIDVPPGDILIFAGDMSNTGDLDDVAQFNQFLGRLLHPHKIVIAGNHDFCFERQPQAAQALLTNCVYLQDEAVEIDGLKIYGCPWQPWFFDFAFNLQRGPEIRAKWALIPPDTDILVTHGPPAGHGSKTSQQIDAGCVDLLEVIEQIKPKYHIFGHIHEGYGITTNTHTTFINASICNVGLQTVNKPIVFQV